MSEQNGQKAHQILSDRYSNIPSWEETSPRTKDLLKKVGDHFAKLDTLDAAIRQAEADLIQDAKAVETSLVEEVGALELRPVDQMAMLKQMLGLGDDDSFPPMFEDVSEPESDPEPSIH